MKIEGACHPVISVCPFKIGSPMDKAVLWRDYVYVLCINIKQLPPNYPRKKSRYICPRL